MRKIAMLAILAALVLVAASPASAWRSNHFYSPTGNIECVLINSVMLGCKTFNNGRTIYLLSTGRPFSGGPGYAWFRPGVGPTLIYNRTWTAFGYSFNCTSLITGMQCENRVGHGFKIAREGISRF